MPLTIATEAWASTTPQVVQRVPAVQPLPYRAAAPLASTVLLFLVDVLAWALAADLVYGLRTAIWGEAPSLWVTGLASVAWFAFRIHAQLYPGYGLAPAEELRRTVLTTLLAAISHATMLLAAGQVNAFGLLALWTWLFVLPIARTLRAIAKYLLIRAGQFGRPIVVIGAGEKGERAVSALRENPDLGFVPVAVFSQDATMQGRQVEGVPVIGSIEDAARRKFPYPVRHAMLALSRREVGPDGITRIVQSLARRYPTLQIFPDLPGLATLWSRSVPMGTYLGLEIPHARFSVQDRRLKRAFDLTAGIPILLASLPLIGVSALLVKIFSPGPAFFFQQREGRGGRRIWVCKIRTMVPDAEARLAAHLRENADARFEWQRFMKLRKDPRIVPVVGSLLRRSSIDELPQLWHVLKGDMSLVGPRPFPKYHLDQFSKEFRKLRRQVPPGLTGLWQVNHRNSGDVAVQERVDTYYVHNWSLWLDLWILLRTIRVVLTGAGAY